MQSRFLWDRGGRNASFFHCSPSPYCENQLNSKTIRDWESKKNCYAKEIFTSHVHNHMTACLMLLLVCLVPETCIVPSADCLFVNKISQADVIMSLAGSNGGSWSTNLPKTSARTTTNDSCLPSGDHETSIPADWSLAQKYRNLLSAGANSIHGLGSGNSLRFSSDSR